MLRCAEASARAAGRACRRRAFRRGRQGAVRARVQGAGAFRLLRVPAEVRSACGRRRGTAWARAKQTSDISGCARCGCGGCGGCGGCALRISGRQRAVVTRARLVGRACRQGCGPLAVGGVAARTSKGRRLPRGVSLAGLAGRGAFRLRPAALLLGHGRAAAGGGDTRRLGAGAKGGHGAGVARSARRWPAEMGLQTRKMAGWGRGGAVDICGRGHAGIRRRG